MSIFLGQVIGDLTVVRETEGRYKPAGKHVRQFECKCVCGNTAVKDVAALKNPKYAKHCGCKKRKSRAPSLRPNTILDGSRFGSLTVEKTFPEITIDGVRHRAYCLCRCDCGEVVEKNVNDLKRLGKRTRYQQTFVNCGDIYRHLVGPTYPPTPTPYPKEAWAIVEKYQDKILSPLERVTGRVVAGVEDVRREQLIRAAWIIVFRRSQGEIISDRHEKQMLLKYFCHADKVAKSKYWRTISDKQDNRLRAMTEQAQLIEPVIETLADVKNCAKIGKPRKFVRR